MFQKGKSGNPSGRPKLRPEIKAAILNNGALAVLRMSDLLNDDAVFGKFGWIKAREQILLLSIAQERAFGKPHDFALDHGGSVAFAASKSEVIKRLANSLPERKAQNPLLK